LTDCLSLENESTITMPSCVRQMVYVATPTCSSPGTSPIPSLHTQLMGCSHV
jgi:hypothetical protein